MSTASAAIYHGATRAERRRIGKELGRLKEAYEATEPLRERVRTLTEEVRAIPDPEQRRARAGQVQAQLQPLARLLSPATIPIRLLACGNCGHPTPSCICVGPDEKPLDWRRE